MGERSEGHMVATQRGILKGEKPWTNCKSEKINSNILYLCSSGLLP